MATVVDKVAVRRTSRYMQDIARGHAMSRTTLNTTSQTALTIKYFATHQDRPTTTDYKDNIDNVIVYLWNSVPVPVYQTKTMRPCRASKIGKGFSR